MLLKSRLMVLMSALIWANFSFANHSQPDACPSINSIQSIGLSMSSEISQGVYLAYNLNHYNSSSNWVFIIGPIMAEDEERAIVEGNKSLSLLSGNPAPVDDGDGNWFCEYDTNIEDMSAFAIEADDMISPLKMMRYLRK